MKKAGQNKFFCPVIIRKPSKVTPDDKSMTIKKSKKRKISYELPQGSISSKITFSSSNKKYHNDIFCRSSVIQYSQIKK